MNFLLNFNQWIIFSIFLFTIIGLVGFSGYLLNKFKINENTTRKIVHIGVGLLASTSAFLFRNSLPAILLATIFIILNWIALIQDKAKGMHSIERKSNGTVYFPISFLLLILIYWYKNPAILIIGMLLMSLSDPLASFVGESKFGGKSFVLWNDKKSIGGTSAAFLSNFFIVYLLFPFLNNTKILIPDLLLIALIVAVIGTLAEIISSKGTDNLTLPVISALMLDLAVTSDRSGKYTILMWIIFSFVFATIAWKARSLSVSGAFGAIFMGSIIFSIGGYIWAMPMMVFFLLSSLVSKIGKKQKYSAHLMSEKGATRDIYQVYANGGTGLICSIIWFYTNNDIFYFAYLASLAAATADTWATEIGILLGKSPRNITTFQKVLPGESGGITIPGTIAAVFGALAIGITALIFTEFMNYEIFIIIIIAGVGGALVDSLLGATIQAQYKCPNCNKITEKLVHCENHHTVLIKGIRWINNDFVNFICTASGALFCILGI